MTPRPPLTGWGCQGPRATRLVCGACLTRRPFQRHQPCCTAAPPSPALSACGTAAMSAAAAGAAAAAAAGVAKQQCGVSSGGKATAGGAAAAAPSAEAAARFTRLSNGLPDSLGQWRSQEKVGGARKAGCRCCARAARPAGAREAVQKAIPAICGHGMPLQATERRLGFQSGAWIVLARGQR